MAVVMVQKWVTNSADEAVAAVRTLAQGTFYDGVTLTIAEARVRKIHQYWKVPLVPSHWPERNSALYEDMAIIEEGLRAKGIDDIILTLSERS